jgi:hypothetical protein
MHIADVFVVTRGAVQNPETRNPEIQNPKSRQVQNPEKLARIKL